MDAQSTATSKQLGKGPRDMPDRGGKTPAVQSTSTALPLTRKEHPVAHLETRASMGEVQQNNSTAAQLSRKASSPYDDINATKPQTPFGGGKRGGR